MSKEFKEMPAEEMDDIIELTDDSGRVLKFFHIGTLPYKERWFVFFQPAEEIDGADEDEVVIFELSGDENDETLLPIEDEALLEEVYEEFCRQMEEDECADEAQSVEGGCSGCSGCGHK